MNPCLHAERQRRGVPMAVVMRSRKVILGAIAFLGLALASLLVSRCRCPVGLRVMDVMAGEDLASGGRTPDHAVFAMANLTKGTLFVSDKESKVRVRSNAGWTYLEDPSFSSYLQAGEKSGFCLCVPRGTELCHFELAYSPESMGVRVDRFLRHNSLCRWLSEPWMWVANRLPKAAQRRITIEIPLPKAPTHHSVTSDQVHNEVTPPDAR
jgi:hypothetical protein